MKFADVKEGDTLIADGGFTCINEGARLTVKKSVGGLYVPCESGQHFLDSQVDWNNNKDLIGFSWPKEGKLTCTCPG